MTQKSLHGTSIPSARTDKLTIRLILIHASLHRYKRVHYACNATVGCGVYPAPSSSTPPPGRTPDVCAPRRQRQRSTCAVSRSPPLCNNDGNNADAILADTRTCTPTTHPAAHSTRPLDTPTSVRVSKRAGRTTDGRTAKEWDALTHSFTSSLVGRCGAARGRGDRRRGE